MIEVLALSDKEVRAKLKARLDRPGPVLLSQVRTDKWMRPLTEREPFASLERRFGGVVDQVVVADAGSIEGMWRDPLGELADRLYPEDSQRAYAASSGYLLLERGQPLAVVKKRSAAADGWFLQEALHRAGLGIPAPDPGERPGKETTSRTGPRVDRPPRDREPERGGDSGARARPRTERTRTPVQVPAQVSQSPWEILGIAPGTPRDEAKKAFRAQVALYHPDKVAHLAPEFQRLAEERTRALLAAWEEIERLG